MNIKFSSDDLVKTRATTLTACHDSISDDSSADLNLADDDDDDDTEDSEGPQASHKHEANVNVPVAITFDIGRNDIETGEEAIIDGEIVIPAQTPKTTKTRRGIDYVFLIIAILSTFVVVVVTVITLKQTKSKSHSEKFYNNLIKQIAIPISGEHVLDDPTSVQYRVWKSLALAMPTLIEDEVEQINDTDKIAQRYTIFVVGLSILKHWTQNGSIIPPDDPRVAINYCTMVQCNDGGEITGLVLRNEWSSRRGGGIMAREIGTLHNVTDMIASRSALQGTIPTDIGKLEHLRVLNLRDNHFTGTIPTEIGQLENLEVLLLDGNLFEGRIPSELSKLKKLRYLGLSQNRLSGSFPTTLVKLNNLTSLALHGNDNDLVGHTDFMCKETFSNESNILELNVGSSTYSYEVDMGITIDCDGEDKNIVCRCCNCV